MSLGNCESLFNVHLSDRVELLFVYLSNYVRASKLPFAGIDLYLLHTEARAPVGGFSQNTVITGSPRVLLMCKYMLQSKYMQIYVTPMMGFYWTSSNAKGKE